MAAFARGGSQGVRIVRYRPQRHARREDEMTRQRIHDTQPMLTAVTAHAPGEDEHSTASRARTDDTEPIPLLESPTDPGPGAEEPARPPMPYEPSTKDPKINSLLSHLKPARAPAALNAPTTDGELAAKYHAPVRDVPARNRTPVPQPKLVLECTAEVAIADVDQTPRVDIPDSRPSPMVASSAPTVILPRLSPPSRSHARPLMLWSVVGVSASAVLAFLIVAVLHDGGPRPADATRNAPASASTQLSATPSLPSFPPPRPVDVATTTTSSLAPTQSQPQELRPPPSAFVAPEVRPSAQAPRSSAPNKLATPPAPTDMEHGDPF